MRWYAFLPLLLVFMLATPTLLPDQAGDLGQVTLAMHATVSSHSHFTVQGCTIDDDVIVTATERVQFRIVAMPNGALDLEMMSHQDSFAANGAGKYTPGKDNKCEGAWTYQIKDQGPYKHIGVWVNLGTGRGGFAWDSNFIQDQELKPTKHIGPAGMLAQEAVQNTMGFERSQEAEAFWKQLEFSFKPYSKNVSAKRSADRTYQSKSTLNPGTVELHVDFSLVTGAQEDSEAEIIPPSEYASWVPEASRDMEKPEDQEKPGNTIKVKARVHKKGDPKTPFYKKARFKFQLINVSKEQGVCLNWPRAYFATHDYDLKIEPKSNDLLKVAGDGQSAESAAGQNESSVTITSYDWGAHGKLKVTVVFDDGSGDTAHVLGDQSKQALTIPKDDNGNHIADFWEKHYIGGSSEAKADDDLVPIGNTDKGDGLSLYEEYRGFRVQRKHIRTSPIEKDLFVRDNNDLGLDYFAQSGLIVHLIEDYEYDLDGSHSSSATNPWLINCNRSSATTCGQQHVLIMWNEAMPGLYGLADGTGPGTPKTTKAAKIDVASCLERSVQKLQATIAHELSHGCNVWHHGEDDYRVSEVEILKPNGTWAKYTSDEPWIISVQGGQESGVEECIMRYDLASYYETPTGSCRWKKPPDGALQRGEPYAPPENPGTIFCNDPKGTGVNAPEGYRSVSKAGNASKGNCKSQFCVNDNKH
jgi:hypothetical protein